MFQESELIDSRSKKHKHRVRQLGLASEEKQAGVTATWGRAPWLREGLFPDKSIVIKEPKYKVHWSHLTYLRLKHWRVTWLTAPADCHCPASQESIILHIASLWKDQNSKFQLQFLLNT